MFCPLSEASLNEKEIIRDPNLGYTRRRGQRSQFYRKCVHQLWGSEERIGNVGNCVW